MDTNNTPMPNREERREEARELLSDAKKKKNNSTFKINRLWLWLGVIVLIFILFYWLFTIGLFEDMLGWINGN